MNRNSIVKNCESGPMKYIQCVILSVLLIFSVVQSAQETKVPSLESLAFNSVLKHLPQHIQNVRNEGGDIADDAVMHTLDSYIDQSDSFPAMIEQLPNYLSRALDNNRDITDDWVIKKIDDYLKTSGASLVDVLNDQGIDPGLRYQQISAYDYKHGVPETILQVAMGKKSKNGNVIVNQNDSVIDWLLQHKINIGNQVKDNSSNIYNAMIYAIDNKQHDVLKKILQAGHDPNQPIVLSCRHNQFKSPLSLALKRYNDDSWYYDNSCSFKIPKDPTGIELLLQYKADINGPANEFGETALHEYIHKLDGNMVKYLLRKGTNINHKDRRRKSLLYYNHYNPKVNATLQMYGGVKIRSKKMQAANNPGQGFIPEQKAQEFKIGEKTQRVFLLNAPRQELQVMSAVNPSITVNELSFDPVAVDVGLLEQYPDVPSLETIE